jgi:hypothetical protein
MVAIPSEDAARAAWDALPASVRAEVHRLAEHDRGHPDPAVAAIAVGRARAERWPWWRTAVLGAGLCLSGGGALAFIAVGSTLFDLPLHGWSALALPTLNGFFLMDWAQRLRTKNSLPRATETANLRSFLASPQARLTAPSAALRPRVTPRRVAVSVALVAGVFAVAITSTHISGAPDGFIGGLRRQSLGILVAAAVFVALMLNHARRRPVRVVSRPDGLRFNWRRPIPWRDVTDVAVAGPNAVWSLRDAAAVAVPLQAHGARPEETILPARSYMAATSRSSSITV